MCIFLLLPNLQQLKKIVFKCLFQISSFFFFNLIPSFWPGSAVPGLMFTGTVRTRSKTRAQPTVRISLLSIPQIASNLHKIKFTETFYWQIIRPNQKNTFQIPNNQYNHFTPAKKKKDWFFWQSLKKKASTKKAIGI